MCVYLWCHYCITVFHIIAFHNRHKKCKNIQKSPLSLYFNFMKSNQGKKQHGNRAVKFSTDCSNSPHHISKSFPEMVATVLLWSTGSKWNYRQTKVPRSFSFRVTRFRPIGLGCSCGDSVTPSKTYTGCAQLCSSVSQALPPALDINPMRTAATPQRQRVEGNACRLWPSWAWMSILVSVWPQATIGTLCAIISSSV